MMGLSVRLGDSQVLLPQGLQRNPVVPPGCAVLPVQHPVGQVGDHRIDAAVGNAFHTLQTVHVVYLVLLYGRHGYCFWFPFTKYTNVPYFSFTLFFRMALLMALLVFW